MDLMTKVSKTASFVQQFFEGPRTNSRVDAKLLEPPNLSLWMKAAADYGQFPCRSHRGEIQITLVLPKETTTFEQIANLYRVFDRMKLRHALILADDLPPKSRGVLVRMGIPHVVTGSLIFAPELGLAYGQIKDVPQERISTGSLSPVGLKLTAAYLLGSKFFLNNPTLTELHRVLKKEYPVSIATLSRAFQLLQELEIVASSGHGPHKRMHFIERQQVWSRLLDIPFETVVRRIETRHLPSNAGSFVFSGESALSKLSDLIEPNSPTIAMSVGVYKHWKETRERHKENLITDLREMPCTIEIWRDDPCFLSEKRSLNSIELALSLRSHTDERVQIAITQILERFELKWDSQQERQRRPHGKT